MQALCILDTAAAFSLLPGAAALAEQEPDAFDELLTEDLRRRLVTNRLDSSTAAGTTAAGATAAGSVAVLLDEHPAVKAATPAAGESMHTLGTNTNTCHTWAVTHLGALSHTCSCVRTHLLASGLAPVHAKGPPA
jgi:hypothetical protein